MSRVVPVSHFPPRCGTVRRQEVMLCGQVQRSDSELGNSHSHWDTDRRTAWGVLWCHVPFQPTERGHATCSQPPREQQWLSFSVVTDLFGSNCTRGLYPDRVAVHCASHSHQSALLRWSASSLCTATQWDSSVTAAWNGRALPYFIALPTQITRRSLSVPRVNRALLCCGQGREVAHRRHCHD